MTVVIPAYHRPEALERAIRSVLAQDLPCEEFEIVVVDSSSNKQTAEMIAGLQRIAPCVLRLATKTPEGPGPSRNLGARLGRAPIIAFLDSDCWATPAWLREGLEAFAPGVGLVAGRVQPDPTRPFTVLSNSLVVDRESPLYESANIFYVREAFEQGGGFPADLTPTSARPTGGEDVELGWRVRRAGWKTRFASGALVYHEIVPIPLWMWLFEKRLVMFPRLARRIPELRRCFYARYFYTRAQAAVCLAILGLATSFWSPLTLLAVLPYCALRGSEPTNTLKGPLRVFRIAAYFLKDSAHFLTLAVASLRYRSVVL